MKQRFAIGLIGGVALFGAILLTASNSQADTMPRIFGTGDGTVKALVMPHG